MLKNNADNLFITDNSFVPKENAIRIRIKCLTGRILLSVKYIYLTMVVVRLCTSSSSNPR